MYFLLTNAEKHFMLNNAYAHSQQNIKDSVIWLAQMIMCLITYTINPF